MSSLSAMLLQENKPSAADTLNKAKAFLVDGEHQQAIAAFKEAQAAASTVEDKVEALLGSSASFHAIDDGMSAHKDALAAIELAPTDPRGHFRKGMAAFSLQEYVAAQLAFEHGFRLATEQQAHLHLQWELWIRKSSAEIKANDKSVLSDDEGREEADREEEAARSDDDQITSGLQADAKPAVDDEAHDDASTTASSSSSSAAASSSEPSLSSEELKELGNTAFKAGDFREAVRRYGQAIALDPKNPLLYGNRAAAFDKLRWHQRSLEDAQKMVSLDPSSVKAHWRLGSCYLIGRQFREAQSEFMAAFKIEPTNGPVRQGLAVCQFALRYPELSGPEAPDLFEEDGTRLPMTRVQEIVRQNIAFLKTESYATDLSKTRRQLNSVSWVTTARAGLSPVGKLVASPPSGSRIDFIRIMCRVCESSPQVYSYHYNKPEEHPESLNPALARMSPAVNLTATQKVLMNLTMTEVNRQAQTDAQFNPFLLAAITKN